jgi:pentatricopeptide repeat protein
MAYRYLAACYAHMGRLDEAHEIVERLKAITPIVVPSGTVHRSAEIRELLFSGLHLAMDEAV